MTFRTVLSFTMFALWALSSGCSARLGADATGSSSPKPGADAETDRDYAKGGVGTTAFCQLYADEWDRLSPRERLYAYYLAEASMAGRDLYYDQMHRDALAVRGLMEGIVTRPGGTEPEVLDLIRAYLRKVWVDGRLYDGHTSLKIRPAFTREELLSAAVAAEKAGAEFRTDDTQEKATAKVLVGRLSGLLFDPTVDPILTAREPKDGKDIVQRSAVNFYQDVTLEEVETLDAKYRLNSTIVKRNGRVVEEPWRIGTEETIPAGRYARELTEAVGWLEKAIEVATPEDKAVLEPLVRFYRTGEYGEFRDHSIAWLKASPSIEVIHGFIESYDDPRGEKASFEGYVMVFAEDLSKRMQALGEQSLYLEERAPWDAAYKKSKIDPPVARAYEVVAAGGAGGKTFPVGINLPNPQDIREKFGSKSLYLANVAVCADAVSTRTMLGEFALEEDRAEIGRYGRRGYEAMVALHEVAGHASGRVNPELEGSPSSHIKEYYATLEEARADLVALWNIGDPKLIEVDVVEAPGTRRAMYKHYVMNVLAQLRRAPEGEVLGQDHLRARQLIVEFAREKGAVETVERDGKTFYRLVSEDSFRNATGELLAELMRIKAEGDYDAAKQLIEKHGVRFDPALRDEVVERSREAGVPSAFSFMPPRMVPVKDRNGKIIDVRLDYSQSFDEMNLRYSGRLR